MNRVDFEQTTLFYFLKEHYYELGGLTPMMDQIPDIDFDFLIQWFLDQFNNSVTSYDWEDANDCLRYWHEVKTFLGRNKWRIDDDYKWKIFRTVIIDIETRTQEIKDYFLQYRNSAEKQIRINKVKKSSKKIKNLLATRKQKI